MLKQKLLRLRLVQIVWVLLALNGVSSNFVSLALAAKASQTPDHLVLMVFDQMRPDYIERYDLKNFKRLASRGTNYSNAYVGYVGAETAVSHFVIPSGLEPRELPWQDDGFLDQRNILGGGAGSFYLTGSLSNDQFLALMKAVPQEQLIPSRLKRKFPDAQVFSVGQKAYATVLLGTPQADSVISIKKESGVCRPAGIRVPGYISNNDRYTLACKEKFGTDGSLYPLDGARAVPGKDPAHQGGDIWVADIAREIMDREAKWRGIFLTFAGIDKMGHLTGDLEGIRPHSFNSEYSFEEVLRIADAQLGRVLDKLEEKGLTQRTLVVVTSDHGAQVNRVYLGNGQKYHGGEDLVNDPAGTQPFFIDRLLKTGRVRVNFQGTWIRLWLRPERMAVASSNAPDPHATAKAEAEVSDAQLERMLAETTGLVEIYRLKQNQGRWVYQRVYQDFTGQTPSFVKWAKQHHQELVDAAAAPNAPNLIGLLADEVGFDLPGDHGGAQEKVQRIPILIQGGGTKPGRNPKPMRLVDLNAEISRLMGLQ